VIDTPLVRQLLRTLRKRKFRSNRTAADAAGLSAFTVAKVENLKTWPNYDPGIGIVLKLLNAFEISLATFVSELAEMDLKFEALQAQSPVGQTPTPNGTVLAPPASNPDEGLPPLPSEEELERIVLRILARNAVEGRERADTAHRQQAPDSGAETPPRPRHRRNRDRRDAPRTKKRRPGKRS
jgi:DNA-binding XRE family transcriptional regulator